MIYFYLLKIQHFAIMVKAILSFFREKTFDQVINNLQTDFRTLKVWFYDNFLVLNPKKCHFMTPGNSFTTFHVMT